jgi:peptidoglycan/LPS O-acetylase OafA/YrhL
VDAPTIIKPLTSLRFVAAAMVVAHHYFGFSAGYAGVTFFYVLSGFILTVNYGSRIDTAEQRRDFWWKRFARIYPTHLLTLIVSVPVAATSLAALAYNLFLVHSLVPSWDAWFSFNSVSWSISAEAAFYAVFPWLLRWLSVRKLLVWGAGTLAFAAAWSILRPHVTMDDGATHFLFYIAPPLRLFEFAAGVMMGLRFSRVPLGIMAELGALALALLCVGALYLNPPAAFAASIMFIPGAAALVYVFSRSTGPLAVALSTPGMVLLGDASFSLYMIHLLVRRYVEHWTAWTPTIAAIAAGTSVLASIALYVGFEKPAQRFLLRLRLHRTTSMFPPSPPSRKPSRALRKQ